MYEISFLVQAMDLQHESSRKMNFFSYIFQGFGLLFRNTYFKEIESHFLLSQKGKNESVALLN